MTASHADLRAFEPLERLAEVLAAVPATISGALVEAQDEFTPRLQQLERATEAAEQDLRSAERQRAALASRSGETATVNRKSRRTSFTKSGRCVRSTWRSNWSPRLARMLVAGVRRLDAKSESSWRSGSTRKMRQTSDLPMREKARSTPSAAIAPRSVKLLNSSAMVCSWV